MTLHRHFTPSSPLRILTLRRLTRTSACILAALLIATTATAGKPVDPAVVIKGTVVDENGKGIGGVVVNNGVMFTKTDRKGAWQLPTDTAVSRFISISTPREYHLPQSEGLAKGHYMSAAEAAKNKGANQFTLTRREDNTDFFHYIVVSDPQILNAHDMKRWKSETVADIMRTANGLRKTGEVVAMTLGDEVFDNMALYNEYVESIKSKRMVFFQTIGNHDFNKALPDRDNSPLGSTDYAERNYEDHFGPLNYSFNIGKCHIVSLKSIDYKGNRRYEEVLSDLTLNWLEQDLSYVPEDVVVIINMHAPAWNQIEQIDNILNADRLQEIVADHECHVFAGHTHFFENVEVTPHLYQHNIAAACGAWWTSDLNRDGAPCGYMVADVYGREMKWRYKGANHKDDYRMRVYRQGEFATQKDYIVANVWDYDPHCRVVYYEDGKYKGHMQQFTDHDQAFIATQPKTHQLAKTSHLFRAKPSSKKYRYFKVVLINRFGETFSYTIENRNNRPFLLE